jgi:hypothetical protein
MIVIDGAQQSGSGTMPRHLVQAPACASPLAEPIISAAPALEVWQKVMGTCVGPSACGYTAHPNM